MPRKNFKRKSNYDSKQDRAIRRLQKQVKQEEIKVFDDFGAATALSAITRLLPIAEGTGFKERISNKVLLKHFAFRYHLNMNALTTANPCIARIMLVRDNHSDGVAPTLANILPLGNPLSFVNRTTMPGRFSILYDRMHEIALSATGVPVTTVGHGLYKKSWKVGKALLFDGINATDTKDGQIFLVCTSNDAAQPPSITWDSRGLYTDA